MKKHVNRKTAFIVIAVAVFAFLLLYAVLSTWYIVDNEISKFKNVQLYNAITQTKTDTVNTLIQEASNKECQPFPVYSGANQVYLINVNCLKQANDNTNTGTGIGTPTPTATPADEK